MTFKQNFFIILLLFIHKSIQLIEPIIETPQYISQSASDPQANEINISSSDLVGTIETAYTVWFRYNLFEKQDNQNIETRINDYIHISGLYNIADISQGCTNNFSRWSTLLYRTQYQFIYAINYKDSDTNYSNTSNEYQVDLKTLDGQWIFVYQGYSIQTQEAVTYLGFTDNITANYYNKDSSIVRTQDPLLPGLSLVLGNCNGAGLNEFSGKFFNPQVYYGIAGSSFLSSEAQIQAYYQRIIRPLLYNRRNDQMFYELQGNTEKEITSSDFLTFQNLEEFSHYDNEYAIFGWFKINDYIGSNWQEILRLTNTDAVTDIDYCGDRQIATFYRNNQVYSSTYHCYYNTLSGQKEDQGQSFSVNNVNNKLDQWIWLYHGYKYSENKHSRYYFQESDSQNEHFLGIRSHFKLFNPLISIGNNSIAFQNPFSGFVKNIYISLGTGSYLESGFGVFKDNLQGCPNTHTLITGTPNKYQICETQCVTCSTSISTCDTCTHTQNRSPPECDCDNNFYGDLNGSTCTQCTSPCYNCQYDSTTCLSCIDHYYFNSSDRSCTECNYKCYNCDTSITDCIDCSDVNRDINNNCDCIDTFYDEVSISVCQPCQEPCVNCTSDIICTSCIAGTYFDNIDSCINCQEPCQNCTSDTTCTSCIAGTYFDNIDSCLNCQEPCVNCTSDTLCTSCIAGTYFDNIDSCINCQEPCVNCTSDTLCTSCIAGTYFDNINSCINCQEPCVNCTSDILCTSCIAGTYFDNINSCINCQEPCVNCTSAIICTSCIDGTYFDNTDSCLNCQEPCLTCNSDIICTSCIDGTYFDNIDSCISCDKTCNKCSLVNGCLQNQCKKNRINDNQNQKCICPTDQSSIDHESEGSTEFILCSTCEEAGYVQNLIDTSQLKMEFSIELTVNQVYTEDITIYNNQLCIQIFDQQSRLLFGEFPKCKILTVTQNGRQESSIYIQFSYTSTYLPNQLSNSNIVFNQNFLQRVDSNCLNTQFINQIELISQTTSYTTVLPVISITGATKLLYCQDLEINIIDSQYDGYRELSSIDWVFTYEYNLDNTNHIDELNNSFSINFQNLYNFKLPKFNLLEGGKYTLNINFSNYLGMSSSRSVIINIGNKDIAQIGFVENIMPLVFEPWETIVVDIQFKHMQCQGGQLIHVLDTQLFYSIELLDNLQDFNTIENLSTGQSQKELQNILEYQLEQYKYAPNSVYFINFIGKLSESDTTGQNLILEFSVESSPLFHYFKGGSRLQSYSQELNLEVIFKDLNVIESQQQLGFTQEWSCLDLNNDLPCKNVQENLIEFNQTETIQYFPSKYYNPFISYEFKHKITKNTQESIQKIVVTVVEMDAPSLALSVPDSIQIQTVNLNDFLQLEISYPKNPDDLSFSIILIYELDKVAIKPFYYTKFSFKIMDLFNNFIDGKTDLIIKISCYDIDYLMPAVATFKVTANLPPNNGNLQVTPQTGSSIATQFKIEALSFVDDNLPLTYKFQYYLNIKDMELDVKNGQQATLQTRKVLTSYQLTNTLDIFLPSQQQIFDENNNDISGLIIQVIVQDNKGGTSNITQTIQVTQDQSTILNDIEQKVPLLDDLSISTQQSQISILTQELNKYTNSQLPDNTSNNNKILSISNQIYQKLITISPSLSNSIEKEQNKISQTLIIQIIDSVQQISEEMFQENFINLENSILQINQEFNHLSEQNLQESQNVRLQNKKIQNQEILAKNLDGLDQLSSSIIKINDSKETNDANNNESINEQNNKIVNNIKLIGDTYSKILLPNSEVIQYKGKQIQSTIQKSTYKPIKNLFSSSLQSYIKMDNNENQQQDDLDINGIYNTQFSSFEDNSLFKFSPGFNATEQFSKKIQDMDILNELNEEITLVDKELDFDFGFFQQDTIDEVINNNREPSCQQQTQDSWNHNLCQTLLNEALQIVCRCEQITAVSVSTSVNDALNDKLNQLEDAFSGENFNIVLQFEYYKSIIFYFYIVYIIIQIITIHHAKKYDKKSLKQVQQEETIQNIDQNQNKEQPLKQISEKQLDNDVQLINLNSPQINEQMKTSDLNKISKSNSDQDLQDQNKNLDIQDVDSFRKLSIFDVNTPASKKSKNKRKRKNKKNFFDYLIQNKDEEVQSSIEDSNIKDQQKFNNTTSSKFKLEKEHQSLNSSQNIPNNDKQNINEQNKNQQKQLQSEQNDDLSQDTDQQPQKQQPNNEQSIFNQFWFFHEIFQIHFVFNPKKSRVARYLIYFIKTVFSMAIVFFFYEEYSIYVQLAIGLIVNIFSSLILVIFRALILNKHKMFNIFGIIVYIVVYIFSFYILIIRSAAMGLDDANEWTVSFLMSSFLDISFNQSLIAMIKTLIVNKYYKDPKKFNLLKKMNDEYQLKAYFLYLNKQKE